MQETTATPTWTDGLGRKAGTVYFDKFGRRRVVAAPEFYDDAGNLVATGSEAVEAFNAHLDAVQEHNRQVLARLKPHEVARFESWLRTRTHAQPPVRPPSSPATSGLTNGRAPREARNERRRGSRRGARATSSSSDDPEPEPPGSRFCQYGKCGKPIDDLNADARYCGAVHRVYAQRERDRREPERLAERRLVLLAEAEAPAPVRCRCSPRRHLVDENVCVQCGRPRGVVAVAWLTEARDLRSRQLAMRSPARRNPRYGDRKRKPATRRWVKPVAA